MLSESVRLAEDVAELINVTPYDWPEIWTGDPGEVGLGSTIQSKAYVLPVIPRQTEAARISIAPIPLIEEYSEQSDNCDRRWIVELDLSLSQKLDDRDSDFEQPATLDSIDKLILMVESLRDFIDDHRLINNQVIATLLRVSVQTYDEEQIRSGSFFLSTIRLSYLIS